MSERINRWAVIDAGRVLRAVVDEEQPGAVSVPLQFDLEIGKYRIDDDGVWQPIISEFKRTKPPREADMLIAIALGFRALQDQGFALPAYTAAWVETFVRWSSDLPFDHDVTKALAQWRAIDKKRKAGG